jgi:hypothetical protein
MDKQLYTCEILWTIRRSPTYYLAEFLIPQRTTNHIPTWKRISLETSGWFILDLAPSNYYHIDLEERLFDILLLEHSMLSLVPTRYERCVRKDAPFLNRIVEQTWPSPSLSALASWQRAESSRANTRAGSYLLKACCPTDEINHTTFAILLMVYCLIWSIIIIRRLSHRSFGNP